MPLYVVNYILIKITVSLIALTCFGFQGLLGAVVRPSCCVFVLSCAVSLPKLGNPNPHSSFSTKLASCRMDCTIGYVFI